MATSPEPRAAGAIIALTTIVGAVIGNFAGQPTLGVLGGFAIGGAIALAVWVKDRRQDIS